MAEHIIAISFRLFNRETDEDIVRRIIEEYYTSPPSFMSKMPSEIEVLLASNYIEEDATFVALEKDKIVGFVGTLIREYEDDLEGEIIGLSTVYPPTDERYYYVLNKLLELTVDKLKMKGVRKATTVASPRNAPHYRLLMDFGFRPIKAWYLMRVKVDEIKFPEDIVKELEIVSFAKLEKERRSKIDLILSILNAAFFGELGGGWNEWELALKFSTPYFDPEGILIGYIDGKPVGLVWVTVEPKRTQSYKGKRGWVVFLGLKPEYRGRRYGRTLLKSGIDYLIEEGVNEILLWVNSDNSVAVNLYKMFNFWIDRTSYLMWLPL